MAVVSLSTSMLYHFNVIYNHAKSPLSHTPDTRLSLQMTRWMVQSLERVGLVNSYYHDRDKRPNLPLAVEMDRVLAQSEMTILILTPGFVKNCFYQYTHINAFRRLLDDTSSRLMVLQFGQGPMERVPAALWGHDIITYPHSRQQEVLFWCHVYSRVGSLLLKGDEDSFNKDVHWKKRRDELCEEKELQLTFGNTTDSALENYRDEPENVLEDTTSTQKFYDIDGQTDVAYDVSIEDCNNDVLQSDNEDGLSTLGSLLEFSLLRTTDQLVLHNGESQLKLDNLNTSLHRYSPSLDDSMQTPSTLSQMNSSADLDESDLSEPTHYETSEGNASQPQTQCMKLLNDLDQFLCLGPGKSYYYTDPNSTRAKYQEIYERLLYMDELSSNKSDTDASEQDETYDCSRVLYQDFHISTQPTTHFHFDQDEHQNVAILDNNHVKNDTNYLPSHVANKQPKNDDYVALLRELHNLDPGYGWHCKQGSTSEPAHNDTIRVPVRDKINQTNHSQQSSKLMNGHHSRSKLNGDSMHEVSLKEHEETLSDYTGNLDQNQCGDLSVFSKMNTDISDDHENATCYPETTKEELSRLCDDMCSNSFTNISSAALTTRGTDIMTTHPSLLATSNPRPDNHIASVDVYNNNTWCSDKSFNQKRHTASRRDDNAYRSDYFDKRVPALDDFHCKSQENLKRVNGTIANSECISEESITLINDGDVISYADRAQHGKILVNYPKKSQTNQKACVRLLDTYCDDEPKESTQDIDQLWGSSDGEGKQYNHSLYVRTILSHNRPQSMLRKETQINGSGWYEVFGKTEQLYDSYRRSDNDDRKTEQLYDSYRRSDNDDRKTEQLYDSYRRSDNDDKKTEQLYDSYRRSDNDDRKTEQLYDSYRRSDNDDRKTEQLYDSYRRSDIDDRKTEERYECYRKSDNDGRKTEELLDSYRRRDSDERKTEELYDSYRRSDSDVRKTEELYDSYRRSDNDERKTRDFEFESDIPCQHLNTKNQQCRTDRDIGESFTKSQNVDTYSSVISGNPYGECQVQNPSALSSLYSTEDLLQRYLYLKDSHQRCGREINSKDYQAKVIFSSTEVGASSENMEHPISELQSENGFSPESWNPTEALGKGAVAARHKSTDSSAMTTDATLVVHVNDIGLPVDAFDTVRQSKDCHENVNSRVYDRENDDCVDSEIKPNKVNTVFNFDSSAIDTPSLEVNSQESESNTFSHQPKSPCLHMSDSTDTSHGKHVQCLSVNIDNSLLQSNEQSIPFSDKIENNISLLPHNELCYHPSENSEDPSNHNVQILDMHEQCYSEISVCDRVFNVLTKGGSLKDNFPIMENRLNSLSHNINVVAEDIAIELDSVPISSSWSSEHSIQEKQNGLPTEINECVQSGLLHQEIPVDDRQEVSTRGYMPDVTSIEDVHEAPTRDISQRVTLIEVMHKVELTDDSHEVISRVTLVDATPEGVSEDDRLEGTSIYDGQEIQSIQDEVTSIEELHLLNSDKNDNQEMASTDDRQVIIKELHNRTTYAPRGDGYDLPSVDDAHDGISTNDIQELVMLDNTREVTPIDDELGGTSIEDKHQAREYSTEVISMVCAHDNKDIRGETSVEEKYEDRQEVISMDGVSKLASIENRHEGASVKDRHEETLVEDRHEETLVGDRHEQTLVGDELEETSVEDKHEETSVEDRHEETFVGDRHEETSVEDRHEETSVEDKHEETLIEDRHEETLVEDRQEETSVEDRHEETSVEDKHEETLIEDRHEETSVEDRHEETSVEDRHGETPVEDMHEETPVEDRHEETSVEDRNERTSVEDMHERTAVEEMNEETLVEDRHDETSVEDRNERTSVEDRHDETSVEDRNERTSVEDRHDETSVEDRNERTLVEDRHDETSVEDRNERTSVEDMHERTAEEDKNEETLVEDRHERTSAEDKNEETLIEDRQEETSIKEKQHATPIIEDLQVIISIEGRQEVRLIENCQKMTTVEDKVELTSLDEKQEVTSIEDRHEVASIESGQDLTTIDGAPESISIEKRPEMSSEDDNQQLKSPNERPEVTSIDISETMTPTIYGQQVATVDDRESVTKHYNEQQRNSTDDGQGNDGADDKHEMISMGNRHGIVAIDDTQRMTSMDDQQQIPTIENAPSDSFPQTIQRRCFERSILDDLTTKANEESFDLDKGNLVANFLSILMSDDSSISDVISDVEFDANPIVRENESITHNSLTKSYDPDAHDDCLYECSMIENLADENRFVIEEKSVSETITDGLKHNEVKSKENVVNVAGEVHRISKQGRNKIHDFQTIIINSLSPEQSLTLDEHCLLSASLPERGMEKSDSTGNVSSDAEGRVPIPNVFRVEDLLPVKTNSTVCTCLKNVHESIETQNDIPAESGHNDLPVSMSNSPIIMVARGTQSDGQSTTEQIIPFGIPGHPCLIDIEENTDKSFQRKTLTSSRYMTPSKHIVYTSDRMDNRLEHSPVYTAARDSAEMRSQPLLERDNDNSTQQNCKSVPSHTATSQSSSLQGGSVELTESQIARKRRRGTNVDGLPSSSSSSSSSSEEDQGDWALAVYKGVCHGVSKPEMPFLG